MERELKFDSVAVGLELLPVAVQAVAILAVLVLTYGQPAPTMFALIASMIWLNVTKDKSVQEFGALLADKRKFSTLGGWLGREDAAEEFDRIQAECLMFEGGLERDEYTAVATSKGIANAVRGALSFVLQCYLVITAITVLWDRWGG